MSAATPGRAAYEATVTQAVIDGHGIGEYPAWEHLEPWQRDRWDVGARAVAPALAGLLDGARRLRDETMDELFDALAERDDYRDRLRAKDEGLTGLAAERDAALALLAEVFAEFKHTPPGHSAESVIAVVLPERFAGWVQREAAIRGAVPDGGSLTAAGEGDGEPGAPAGALGAGERDAVLADLGEMLEALGLGNYARPESPHQVFRQCLAEVTRLRARLAGYENAITWDTSCTSCARTLDRSIAEHERAAKRGEVITEMLGWIEDLLRFSGSSADDARMASLRERAQLPLGAEPVRPDCGPNAEWATVRPSAEGGQA